MAAAGAALAKKLTKYQSQALGEVNGYLNRAFADPDREEIQLEQMRTKLRSLSKRDLRPVFEAFITMSI